MVAVQDFMKVDGYMNFMSSLDKLSTHDESALSSILNEQNVFVQRLIKQKERVSSYDIQ